MDDSISSEEVNLDNGIGNNIPVHISSRRNLISPSEISPEEDEEESLRKAGGDHNNTCQIYTVNANEEYVNRGIPRNSFNQNNVVLRELPTSTGKSDSEFTEDEDIHSFQTPREGDQNQNAADLSHSLFFNHDGLIEKGIIKIINRPDTGSVDDSACFDPTCSHSLGMSSVDSSCCNSDKENISPFPDLNSDTCSAAISTPATYKHNDSLIVSKNYQVGIEMVDSMTIQSHIKKEVICQNSSIYEESVDTSNSVYSKMSSPISSYNSTPNTSVSVELDNNTSLMLPNSYDTSRMFSGHSLNSSAGENSGFVPESPMRSLESEENASISQKSEFSNCYASCGQNSIDLGISINKDIGTGFMKGCTDTNNTSISVENNVKKCVDDFRNNEDNTFSGSPTSSCESNPFTSILGNDSRYQDQSQSQQLNSTRLLGCCQDYEKETPRSILSRMQGVDLFIKQPPFLKTNDIRPNHMTSTPLYKQQKLQENLMEMPSSQHVRLPKTSQHSSQILHTPHPKHGQLIYCHSILDNATEFQAKTPMIGPILNSSGEENNSPPDYMPCTNTSFSTPENEDRVSLTCLKSDLCHEDDPIRHQHNLNERKRRARITIACDLMRRLVPGLSDKTDQATVFEYAARYIHFLQTQVGNKYNRNFLVKYSPYKLMEIEKFLP